MKTRLSKRVKVPLLRSLLALTTLTHSVSALSQLTKVQFIGKSKNAHALSVMGGGTISIEGVGFAEIPSDNLVRFEVDNANIDGYAVGDILSGPPLLESDEGESSTSAGVLVYTVPGIEELTGRPLDTFTSAFDGSIVLSLQISVLNTDTDEVMECTHGHTCDVKFRYDYTPQLHDIIPNNAWAGAEVVLMMDPAFTRYQITAEEGPYESIKVGHAHTNYEGLMESTYRGHNLQPNRYPIYLGSETQVSLDSPPTIEYYTGLAKTRTRSRECSFDGTDCWTLRIHPRMDYVDKHYGSTNGGEKIKIYGQGFGKDKDAVEVLAGGMPCKIKKVSDDEIVCKTDKAKDNLPTINGVSHPGARGLKRTVVDPANESWGVGKTQFQRGDYPVISESLVTSFEVFDDLTKAGNKLSGYFKPPATGNYRFTVSCDDHCYLDFDSSPWIEGVEPTWTEIAYRIGASGWRQNQFENDPDTLDKLKVKSDWFFLLEGEFYPIRAWHIEGSGSDHVSVGMEFEESDSSASVHASKQIQKFEILQDNVAEQWQVSVYFPDQGCYKLTFAIMGDPPTVWASQCISSSASANTFRDSVKSFFWDNYRSAITVTRDEVLSGSTVIRYDYTVSLSKSIIGQSFDMIIGAKVTTMSQIAAMPPSVLSTPPISGKYKIQCTDQYGATHTTSDINYNTWWNSIQLEMEESMPSFAYSLRALSLTTEYAYRENGVQFIVEFDNIGAQIPDCVMLDSDTQPITGNSPIFQVTTIQDFGVNRSWEVIPFDYLWAETTDPQIQVTIDGIEGICPTLDCHYAYVSDDEELAITSQSLDGQTLTLTGIKLPKWGSGCDAPGARRMLYMTQNIQDDTQDSHSEDSQSNDQGGEERNTGFGSGKSNSEGSEGYSDNEQDFQEVAYSENDGTGLVDEEEEENEDDEEQDEDTDDEVSETDSDLERGRRLSSDEDAMSSDSGKSYGESSKSENNKSNKTEKSTTESEDTQKSLKEDSKSSASDYNCGSSSDYEVEFGGVVCDVSTVHADGTQIVCELTDPPQAGCHYAVVTSPWGYVPIDYTLVEEICIDLVVDNVTPDRDLNPNGGDVLDVDGSGFPDNVDDVIAELDDGTPCQVISSTPTFLQCIPDKPSGLGPFCLNVYVNSLTDSYCDLLFDGINYGIEGFYPQCVSPVEDQFVTLTLDSAFPVAELDRTLFTATVQPLDPLSDYPVTNLYVASADTVNKSIDVKFNGAPTGEYEVILVHDNLGVVGSDDFIFETRSFITSVSANGGSNLGGTQLTIDGENFVADASDMMVTVDGYACDIESVTSEQIVCRVTEIATAEQGVQTSSIVVFMKLSEEALNSGSPTCGDTAEVDITWTFEEPTCSILNMDTEFDSLTNKYVVTVDGTGFIDGDLSSISLYIDDLEQETVQVTETQARFFITDMLSTFSSNVRVFTREGLCTGYDSHEVVELEAVYFTILPAQVDDIASGFLTPSQGRRLQTAQDVFDSDDFSTSPGGDCYVIRGSFGKNDDLSVIHMPTGQEFCAQIFDQTFGEAYCQSNPIEVDPMDEIRLYVNGDEILCSADTMSPLGCMLRALPADAPQVNSVTTTQSTVTLTGENFENGVLFGWAPEVCIGGQVTCDDIISVTDTEIVIDCTDQGGVPASYQDQTISVNFVSQQTQCSKQAYSSQQITLQNPPSNVNSNAGVRGSFKGGKKYEITGDNILATLLNGDNLDGNCGCKTNNGLGSINGNGNDPNNGNNGNCGNDPNQPNNDKNRVEVCGKVCEVDKKNSVAAAAVCKLPQLNTKFSTDQWKKFNVPSNIIPKGHAYGASKQDQLAKWYDGDLTEDIVDNSNPPCFFEVEYPPGQVGKMHKTKFFVKDLKDKTPFVNNLKFRGSNDGGATWDDLWVVDNNICEGWNYKEWENDDERPKYNKYRWEGTEKGKSCRITEVEGDGVVIIDDDSNEYSCNVELIVEGQSTTLEDVVFAEDTTPFLTDISPQFGSILGGEIITFTGERFSDTAPTSITIDGIECVVISQTTTELQCQLGEFLDYDLKVDDPNVDNDGCGYGSSIVVIDVDGMGYAANNGQCFFYVKKWSDPETWGDDIPPQEGDSVHIPSGCNVLFDIPASPILNLVNIEGGLIFLPVENESDPNYDRYFSAHNIMVRNGFLQAGTKEFPYTSKLTITLYGEEYDPYIPLYGNKVLAIRYSRLDMHGQERVRTWTDLKFTANAGESLIILNDMNGDDLDWQVGEEIVIASTDYEGRNSEKKVITSISATTTNPVIGLDSPLDFTHFAETVILGSDPDDFIDMRAEVGLLSRNIVFQGSADSEANEYGAHIMIHSFGDDSSIARIDGVEFRDVGQAYKVGRNPIQFHQIGFVAQSYVRNNAIWKSYNRAVTISGTNQLDVFNNVIYQVKGHAIYLKYGNEIKNCICENVLIDTRQSFSLLNTDQTPASMWITNPDNFVRDNHVAGSDYYGYWYDHPANPIGSAYDPNICPENTPLTEFARNTAHSVGRYGLRIHNKHVPRTFPCEPFEFSGDFSDPYPDNPPITAEYVGFNGWKNGRNGAIAGAVGAVHFVDFKTADNILAGMEIETAWDVIDGYAKVINALTVGRTSPGNAALDAASPHGIIAPRSERFTIEGARFFRYDWDNGHEHAAPLGTASHASNTDSDDTGARHITVSGLQFTDVPVRIRYQTPFRAIFHDLDGSLTDLGANTWAVAYWLHLEQPECFYDSATLFTYGGILCDSSVEVRRLAFWGAQRNADFRNQEMKILKFDNSEVNTWKQSGIYQDTVDDELNYSVVKRIHADRPKSAWAIPFVTNHKYRIHWAEGLDFTQMKLELSERWEPTDQNIIINMNFTDVRDAVDFYSDYGEGMQFLNESLTTTQNADLALGDNIVYNETETRELTFIVNNKDEARGKELLIEGTRCKDIFCEFADFEFVEIEENARMWSDPASWPDGIKPVEGDDVVIESGWNMYLDEDTPILNSLEINGRLTFYAFPNLDLELNAYRIHVRAGELLIGKEGEAFPNQATIRLHGNQDNETLAITPGLEVYNKVLANTGTIAMYGKPRTSHLVRLLQSVFPGQNSGYIDMDLDLEPGDQIYLGPTASQWKHSEYHTIDAYDEITGQFTIQGTFSYYHFGSADTTTDYEGLDMRGEVAILSRNIVIQGEDTDGWGGQVLTTDLLESDGSLRFGKTVMEYVEVRNCSQRDTQRSAVRFEDASGAYSRLRGVSVHSGLAFGINIHNARNIEVYDTIVVDHRQIGLNLDWVRNVTIDGAFVSDIKYRLPDRLDGNDDIEACVTFGSYGNSRIGTYNYETIIKNSIVSGCPEVGFTAPGNTCGQPNTKFLNNVAHSVNGNGAIIYPDPTDGTSSICYEASDFAAYKNTEQGVSTYFDTAEQRFHNMIFVDNTLGFVLQIGEEREYALMQFYDSFVFGDSGSNHPDDCAVASDCYCEDKSGMLFFSHNRGTKHIHPWDAKDRPFYKIIHPSGWGGYGLLTNVAFKKFLSKSTGCGAIQTVFSNNEYASDIIPIHKLDSCTFEDVVDDALIRIIASPGEWATVDQCGDFPCTGPHNVVLRLANTNYAGQTPANTNPYNTITSALTESPYYDNCVWKTKWNGWQCNDLSIGQLIFESLDEDNMDRSIQPIYVDDENGPFTNTLNSFMDNDIDGFYTSQKRLSRFVSQVATQQNDYTIRTTGTTPLKMRWSLRAETGGIKVRIPYNDATSVDVFVDGDKKDMTPWDNALNTPAPLTKTAGCGENRYVGVENFLEFYITAGCEVVVEPRDAIHGRVRMEWTLAEFYADGGTTKFIDRMASVLDIHASRIKTVACYHGSVIVDFFIEALLQTTQEDEPQEVQDEIEAMTKELKTVLLEGAQNLGAPILGVEGNDQVLTGSRIPVQDKKDAGWGKSTAIQLEDNIWDRYQRIQNVIEKQKDQKIEEDQALMGTYDASLSAETVTRAEQIMGLTGEESEIDTLKYTILIIAFLILLSLVFTAFCVYKCFTKQKRNITAIAKAQEKAFEQRMDEAPSQFAPKGDDSLYQSTMFNTSTKANIKRDDTVVIPGLDNDAQQDMEANAADGEMQVKKGKRKIKKKVVKRKPIAETTGNTDRFAQTNSKLNIAKVTSDIHLKEQNDEEL